MRAAKRSDVSCPFELNRRYTTTAERSSMALSPPKASNTGLRAIHAAERDRTASALIQPMVMAWIRRIRWKVADAGPGNTGFNAKDYYPNGEKPNPQRTGGTGQGGRSRIGGC